MKERPILFSGPMVQAILTGHKIQTRRVVKFPLKLKAHGVAITSLNDGDSEEVNEFCPYGRPGDRLWVKETFCVDEDSEGKTAYRADGWIETPSDDGKWKPSIFMPRHRSRITLDIRGVRVERLQSITEWHAQCEGVRTINTTELQSDGTLKPITISARRNFEDLWWRINGPMSWSQNPWVWVITFRRLV